MAAETTQFVHVWLLPTLEAIAFTVACVAAAALIERLRPVQSGAGARLFNLAYAAVTAPLQLGARIAGVGAASIAARPMGGGLLHLPEHGAWVAVSALAYVAAMDFGEYLFHRAQHRSPMLWRMHSLHHSDDALNGSTTVRHFWLEPLLKSCTIYLAVALVIHVTPTLAAAFALAGLYNFVPHLNLRLGLGRWSWIVNSPQYHRLHHSALREHYDRNFASLLPIFDLLLGTYRAPGQGEYPPTGLGPDVAAPTLAWALLPLAGLPVRRSAWASGMTPAAEATA
ncbi:MAG: sterol desaturase family protein [Caulobacteraceae bacterium]|nr:sterol desaturase family protein [Caulobacteraceae bacterium]